MNKRIVVVFLEVVVFYALMQGFNRVILPQFAGFLGINPHPYWLGILIFSISYGTYVGFLTGLVAASLYIFNTIVYLEKYLLEDPSYYVLPILFMLLGLILGEISRRFRRSIRTVNTEKKQLSYNVEKLEEEIKTLWKIKYELEQKVVTQVSTLTTLYEGARQLDSANLNRAYKSIIYFFSKVLEVEEASIYERKEHGWELTESFGWKDYHKDRPESLGPTEGVIGLSGSKNKVVSIRDFVSNKDSEMPNTLGDAIVAGPIRKGENGPVIAVFSIQKIPFLKLNSSTMIIFSFLLNWASRAIEKMNYVKSLKSEAIRDVNYNAFTYRYFKKIGDREMVISKKYGVPTYIGIVKINTHKNTSAHQLDLIKAMGSEIIKESCRESDLVSTCDEEGVNFCFMLISSTDEAASNIKNKIKEQFKTGCSSLNEEGCSILVHVSKLNEKYDSISQLITEEKKLFEL